MGLPKVPGHTCPLIDKVIEFITDAEAYTEGNDFGATKIEDLSALYDHIADEGEETKNTLEEIRSANSDLRTLAEHYEYEAEQLQNKVEELQNEIEDLTREIRALS